MKALWIGFVAVAVLFVGGQDEAAQKKKLVGTWKIAKLVTGDGEKDEFRDAKFILTADGTTELQKGGESKKGTYTIDPAAKPRAIDIANDQGQTMKGIYELKKDTLKIAINVDPNGDRPTEFTAGGSSAVVTLERDKK
jgi:uncharacterized protein (TIGR03067 family)